MAYSSIIITIGDELLIGQVIDTNSVWISQELNKIGISVLRRIAIGDDQKAIKDALDETIPKADIVFLTGGLGPTKDDLTKSALCAYFDSHLVVDPLVSAHVHDIFSRKNRPMLPVNEAQALVPESCQVLFNRSGTAPGMWFEKDNTIIISLPGVPEEMKRITSEEVLSRLSQRFNEATIIHRTLLVMGIGESYVAEAIEDIEDALPTHIKLAYLPAAGILRLKLSGNHPDGVLLRREIDRFALQIKERLGDKIAADGDILPEEALAKLFLEKNKTMGLAESCTGGYLAHKITNVAGCSVFFKGAMVSYSDEIKNNLVQVQEQTLLDHGAVSEAVVKEMAENARRVLDVDIALSVSGILGPGGGSDAKPIGTVWIAISDEYKTEARLFHFWHDRLQNKERAANAAFDWLRLWLTH
jgi:nicotinamide-nucleotide amidase